MTDQNTTTDQEKNFSSRPVPPPVVEKDDFPEELWEQASPAGNETKKEEERHPVPEYLKSVYGRRYFRALFTKLFDDEWMAAVGGFFCGRRLIKAVLREIDEGKDVLQLGIASGDFERKIVQKMNSKGLYCIEDISPCHIDVAKPRVSAWLNAEFKERDFTVPDELRYDVVIGYFVLHEMPDPRKRAVLKRAVNALKPDGKMIFVDYARPKKFHPLKYPVKMFNRLYEPFAESLWFNDIREFAPKTDDLVWERQTFFGDMYQCVIARKH